MNSNSTGYWNKTKEKLKQKYPVITEKDMCFREGKEREMIEILGISLGRHKKNSFTLLQGFEKASSRVRKSVAGTVQ